MTKILPKLEAGIHEKDRRMLAATLTGCVEYKRGWVF